MVFDQRGIIQDGSNKTSEQMFKVNLFESEAIKVKIWDVLKLDKNQKQVFLKWMSNIFKGIVPFKDLLPFAPQRFNKNEFVELQFRPIYVSEKKTIIGKIICIGVDKTKERILEEKMEIDRQHNIETHPAPDLNDVDRDEKFGIFMSQMPQFGDYLYDFRGVIEKCEEFMRDS